MIADTGFTAEITNDPPVPAARLGMLTPSSNTVLEPMTARIFAALPGITSHFGRLRVTEISLSDGALAQFETKPMVDAAILLADARPDAIVWNGTSGGWKGLDADRRIVSAIETATGIRTTTVALALHDLLQRADAKKIAFVTPYTLDVQEQILANYERNGFSCSTSPCSGISENFAFGLIPTREMDEMVAKAAADRPDVIIPLCTNLAATPHAPRWEEEHGITILDSVSIAAYAALGLAGLSPRIVRGWGRIFDL